MKNERKNIFDFFDESTKNETPGSVLFCGMKSSGKTSLIERFINKNVTDIPKPTIGVEYKYVRQQDIISKKKTVIEIYDICIDIIDFIYIPKNIISIIIVLDMSSPDDIIDKLNFFIKYIYKINIKKNNIKLLCFGVDLENNKNLTTQSRISNQSHIQLSIQDIIKIIDNNNKIIYIKIHYIEKIEKIKKLLSDIENIPDTKIHLQYNGQTLLDKLRIEDKKNDEGDDFIRYIGEFTTNIEEIDSNIENNENDIENNENDIENNENNTEYDENNIENNENYIENNENYIENDENDEKIDIKIRYENKKTISININKNDNLYNLKKKIEKILKIPINKQKLIDIYKKTLENNYIIKNINNNITLLKCINICIFGYRKDKKSIFIDVFPCDVIGNIKKKIAKHYDLCIFEFENEILSNEKTIGHYKIEDGAILYMKGDPLNIEIIDEDEEKYDIEMKSYDTVEDLKYTIEEHSNISKKRLKITKNNEILNELSYLYEEGIVNNTKLHIYECIEILVKNIFQNKDTIVIDIHRCDSILHLKGKIQNAININLEGMRIVFQNKDLDYTKKISDYELVDKSEIYLLGRLKGGLI
eukprot:GHVL01039880.1.p1 GENE.GHVL01039880.1~~GHVL01039880.1.p1  ORF type:complete len:589 (+),score=239.12 GHVL01039880.1:1149-2915(+)